MNRRRMRFLLSGGLLTILAGFTLLAHGVQAQPAGQITPSLPHRYTPIAIISRTPVISKTPILIPVTPTPTSTYCGFGGCYDGKMPLYDQTDPNFALVPVPSSIYQLENSPTSSVMSCGSTFLNPYYTSWLPLGPVWVNNTADPGVIGQGTGCGWWLSAICGPTAESMCLMAAIGQKSNSTHIASGSWTQQFYAGQAPPGQVGSAPNPMAVPSPPRSNMGPADIQRVINMGVLQNTNPDSGGGMGAFLQTAGDFTPNAVTVTTGTIDANQFQYLISQGYVVEICLHDHSVSISGSGSNKTATLTYTGGGHMVAVNGIWKGTLLIYNPVYAAEQWVKPVALLNQTYVSGGNKLTVNMTDKSTAAVWSQVASAGSGSVTGVNSVWDLSGGTTVTLIDGFNALKVQ